MQAFEVGMFARAKAGHDTDKIYVILEVQDEYVYLVDGKKRTLSYPKRKNKKHVQVIKTIPEELKRMSQDLSVINDDIIKRAIKLEMKKNKDV